MQTTRFFQSREFAEFQEKIPYRGKGFILQRDGKDICSVIKQSLKFGKSFLWAPYFDELSFRAEQSEVEKSNDISLTPDSPTRPSSHKVTADALEMTKMIFDDLKKIAEEENAIFCRVEPGMILVAQASTPPALSSIGNHERLMKCSSLAQHLPQSASRLSSANHEQFMKCSSLPNRSGKIKKSFERYTPETTLVLDLSLSEEEILKQMKPKGRYNIKIAERHGVVIEQYSRSLRSPRLSRNDSDEFDAFYKILAKTAKRGGFHCHPKAYYENLLQFFGEKNMAELFVAKYHGSIIAGIIVIFYNDTAIYYYGASSYARRDLMAPYLLQWEAIKQAKKRNLRYYDLFGIAPLGARNHSWQGVTEFKKKFGGQIVQYAEAFDIIYQPFWYWLYRCYH